jgi:hypothetical protein
MLASSPPPSASIGSLPPEIMREILIRAPRLARARRAMRAVDSVA